MGSDGKKWDESITMYRGDMESADDDQRDDESDDSEEISSNEDLRTPISWAQSGFNPAGSLITVCPCGCGKEDHSGENSSSGCSSLPSPPATCNFTLPESPELSPVKHLGFSSSSSRCHYNNQSDCSSVSSTFLDDSPLDMSKTSPMFGMTAKEEENDRDKFSCLYLLVDAAVNQLEEIAAKKRRLNH